MITAIIIILAYVANVFLNRLLNKKLYELNDCSPRFWGMWFIPIIPTLALLIMIGMEKDSDNWLTGKHWKKEK